MPIRESRLKGVTPILSMPFGPNAAIVYDDIERQMSWLVGSGAVVAGFGFGSEISLLTREENVAAVRVAATASNEGVPAILATLAAPTLDGLRREAESLAQAGAAIFLLRPPAGSENAAMLIECCQLVAQDTQRPIVLQDAPQFTGVTVPFDGVVQLCREVKAVVAVKVETQDPVARLGRLAAALDPEVLLLGGGGGIEYPAEYLRGARGCVPFVPFTRMFLAVHTALERGDGVQARQILAPFLPLLVASARSLETALVITKMLLRYQGLLTVSGRRGDTPTPDRYLPEEVDAMIAALETAGSW